MNENNKVQKLKTCLVCALLEDDEDLLIKINNLLVTTDKITPKIEPLIASLISSKNIKTPSSHLLNKHKNDCLKDFKAAIEDIEPIEILKNQESEFFIDMDSFKKTTLIEKDVIYQNFFHDLLYKKLFILNQNKKIGKEISKEDINSIKTLYDLVNINNVDVSDIVLTSVKNKDDVVEITLNLMAMILSKGIINSDHVVKIIGSLLKPKFAESVDLQTNVIRETRESLMEKIDKIQKVIDYAKSQEQLSDTVLEN